jgi:hypothetical protein
VEKVTAKKTDLTPIAASKLICRVDEDEMRTKILPVIILCVILVFGCTAAPMRTPNVNDPSLMLPEQVMIEGIKIELGQSFTDCVPVVLEAVLKFYGKNIDRKEIDEKVHKSWGSKTVDWVNYVKQQGFNVYSFYDRTRDKRGIKFFLAQQVPVLSTGSVRVGWQGHIVILVGYDDRKKTFYVVDPEWRATQQKRYLDFYDWHKRQGSYGYVIYSSSNPIQMPLARW